MTTKMDKFITVMDTLRPKLEEVLDIKLDYTPQSLNKLEVAVTRWSKDREVPYDSAAILGAYLGETIKRNVKGTKWISFDDHVTEAHLTVPSKKEKGTVAQVNPFTRFHKFLADPTEGLYGFYCMIQDISNGRMSFEGATEGVSSRGYAYKMTPVPGELYKRYKNGEITEEEMMAIAKKEGYSHD
jgi:hypothetical protein